MKVFADALATAVQRRPFAMRLLTGLGRRMSPVLSVGRSTFIVLGGDEVREVLSRANDFELGPVGGRKMLMGPFLLGMDPRPQYEHERKLLGGILAEGVPRLGRIALEESERALEALGGRRQIELVTDFAEPIVTRTASRFFGPRLPEQVKSRVLRARGGADLLAQWLRKVGSVIATSSPAPFGLDSVARSCAEELGEYLQHEITVEAESPCGEPTVLAGLVAYTRRGDLPRERVLPCLAGLMLAGSTALVKSFVHATHHLLTRPRCEPKLRSIDRGDSRALVGVIFEALRFNPTFPVLMRFCPRAATIGEGSRTWSIAPGSTLFVVPMAAMFDDQVGDPDASSPVRPPENYLHFGFGPHTCLGRTVATIELVEMLRAFLALPDLDSATASRIRYDGPAAHELRITLRPPAGARP